MDIILFKIEELNQRVNLFMNNIEQRMNKINECLIKKIGFIECRVCQEWTETSKCIECDSCCFKFCLKCYPKEECFFCCKKYCQKCITPTHVTNGSLVEKECLNCKKCMALIYWTPHDHQYLNDDTHQPIKTLLLCLKLVIDNKFFPPKFIVYEIIRFYLKNKCLDDHANLIGNCYVNRNKFLIGEDVFYKNGDKLFEINIRERHRFEYDRKMI